MPDHRLRTVWTLVFLFLSLSLFSQATPSPTPTATPAPSVSPTPTASPTTEPEVKATDQVLPELTSPFTTQRDESQVKMRGPFTGRVLMTISAAEGYSAQARAEKIRNRLRAVADDQGREAYYVTSTRYNDQLLALVADDQILATITHEDLDVLDPGNLPEDRRKALEREIADRWRESLQRELVFAAWTKRPEYYRVALPLLALTLLLAGLAHRQLKKAKMQRLGTSIWGLEFLIWGFVLVFSLWLFPATKTLAALIHGGIVEPLFRFWLIFLLATLATNLLEFAIHRYFRILQLQPDVRARRAQRLETFATVACKTIRALAMVVVLGFVIAMLPFNFMPLITGAGVVGIAIGLAAQDSLKDLIAGISILVEDRFGVGDWIEWDKYSGSVESVNLLYTQIRTIQGGLVTIPNSDLRVINNLSNEWAQVDFQVTISYQADLEKAETCMLEEAQALCEQWPERVIEEPVFKGVQALGERGVVLRLFLRTVPLLQWDVERDLNRRLKLRFEKEGIEIPLPQRVVWMREPKD